MLNPGERVKLKPQYNQNADRIIIVVHGSNEIMGANMHNRRKHTTMRNLIRLAYDYHAF